MCIRDRDGEGITLQAWKREQPAGNGGTDVGAHDDADGLAELEDAGVDQAHHDDGGGGGGLDGRGDQSAQQNALEHAAGEAFHLIIQNYSPSSTTLILE